MRRRRHGVVCGVLLAAGIRGVIVIHREPQRSSSEDRISKKPFDLLFSGGMRRRKILNESTGTGIE
jgi:hypothetical protein